MGSTTDPEPVIDSRVAASAAAKAENPSGRMDGPQRPQRRVDTIGGPAPAVRAPNSHSHDDDLLPPIAATTNAPTMRIPLLPENMKMEPTIGTPARRETKRVIVCGAGIIGLTTCYYLAKQGHEVLCVEKEPAVGTQVSFCNGAFLDPAMYASWADFSLLRRGKPQRNHEVPRSTVAAHRTVVNQSEDGSSTEVTEGPAAAAAGETQTAMVPATSKSVANHAAWATTEKPMKIEMSALRDTKFWKWGIQFFRNCKKARSNEHGRTIRELGFYSMLKLRELQAETKKSELDMDQTAQGTIEIFRHSGEFGATMESDRNRHLEQLGMELTPLNSHQAHNLEPSLRPELYGPGAVLSAFGTNGDVHKMCESLYKLCMREGVMFRFNTEVAHVLTDKTSVIALQTRRGALIEGDEFVLALGNSTASVARRAGLNLSIYPIKGYVLSVPVNERFKAPLHNIYAGGNVLVSPLGRVLRISGGVDFAANPKRSQSNQKRYDWLLARASALFPDGYLNTAQMKSHACWRPVTADDVPLIGRTKIRNLYVNAGHGSKGWTLSFGAGALLADEITGIRPKLDMSKFDPHRFGFFG